MNTIHVNLGVSRIDVPVYDIVGAKPGNTLLVTGGMDGDEYAGMEACFRLAGRIKPEDITGRLIVIPVVNIPGFWAETSSNPLDGKFPKFAGVGRDRGTATERLVAWLVETYAKRAGLWLDLHGGSLTEVISPYLWAWETGISSVDEQVKKFISKHSPAFGVFERQRFPSGKAVSLARMGCGYIQGESGGLGSRAGADIRQHDVWVRAALDVLGIMPSGRNNKGLSPVLYAKTELYRSRRPGLWYPSSTVIRTVQKGETLGVVRSPDGTLSSPIAARNSGQLLWIKSGLSAIPSDTLAALAYDTE